MTSLPHLQDFEDPSTLFQQGVRAQQLAPQLVEFGTCAA
jgi:hypothetical protein